MRGKRPILISFAALAAAAALTSTAFACTFFKGTLTITGNSSTTSVTATGDGSNMGYSSITSGIAKASSGGSVKVSTGAVGTNKLPPSTQTRTYQVNFYNSVYPNSPGFTNHTTWKTDCMTGDAGGQLGSNVTIDNTGKIVGQPKTFTLPTGLTSDKAPAESAVCVSDNSALYGNQAPLTIL